MGVVAYLDHRPIILKLSEEVQKAPRRKLFHFEAMWVEDSGCKQVVDGAWKAVEGRRQQIQQGRKDVQEWLQKSEIMWRQRSKVLWLAEGDRNSQFFHHKASQRKKKNCIKRIKDSLEDAAKELGNMDFLQDLNGRVDAQMVDQLDATFTAEEVKRAQDEMHPTKAPGPDGMASIFYQKFWSVVGVDVTGVVLNALNSAFVPGRLIMDNVLVAYEMVQFLRRKRSGKDGFMSLKLDMCKAYDRIEWKFLEEVML
ncbi:uncharacterized protein LOC122298887 [Carya illinoinensis]|uniref:uncharacterized protein LOC122298887 n=1 Tax=Carya illinoinensis TaxID=32201 RepID=UPI001C71D810|nr:uncharacterized protein LOC122298887 [Carya illinoinensis]